MKIIVKNQHEQPKQVSLVLRRDLLDLKNWKPISLSACHLKIILKSLANRLKTVLPDLPFEHQGACIPGWDINFNKRLLRYAKS